MYTAIAYAAFNVLQHLDLWLFNAEEFIQGDALPRSSVPAGNDFIDTQHHIMRMKVSTSIPIIAVNCHYEAADCIYWYYTRGHSLQHYYP